MQNHLTPRKGKSLNKLVVAFLVSITTCQLNAAEVRVAVASNFNDALHAVAKAFEQNSEHEVLISSASTGKLYAQIKQGAPFDVFMSADTQTPKKLITEQLAASQSYSVYAQGQLVLLVNQKTEPNCEDILSSDTLRHVAIANPNTAPYGLAAQQTLNHLGLWDVLKPKLVRGENIAQTMHFVATKNAGAGFVAQSLVTKKGVSSAQCVWVIPNDMYAPINQALVKLKQAAEDAVVDEFLAYINSPEARQIIKSFGYKISQ